jgi:GNAT superfamily N-acetyltransferase
MSGQDEYGGDLPVKEGNSTSIPALGCNHCPAAFFKHESWSQHNAEKHPDKLTPVGWQSGEHTIEFYPHTFSHSPYMFLMKHTDSGEIHASLALDAWGQIGGIQVPEEHRRKGYATKLWNEVSEYAKDEPRLPTPSHSVTRTPEGNEWAKSVGARGVPIGRLISSRQMRGLF